MDRLNDYNLAFLHLSEFGKPGFRDLKSENTVLPVYRNIYRGTLISCGTYTRESAIKAIENDEADLIAFGVPFISNPDLVERFKTNGPLNPPRKETFYHGGAEGYIDYPSLKQNNN